MHSFSIPLDTLWVSPLHLNALLYSSGGEEPAVPRNPGDVVRKVWKVKDKAGKISNLHMAVGGPVD